MGAGQYEVIVVGARAVFPTNDELTMVCAAAPMTEFAAACADLDGHFLRILGASRVPGRLPGERRCGN